MHSTVLMLNGAVSPTGLQRWSIPLPSRRRQVLCTLAMVEVGEGGATV